MSKLKTKRTNEGLIQVEVPEGTILTLAKKTLNEELLNQSKDIFFSEDGKLTFLTNATILVEFINLNKLVCGELIHAVKGRNRHQAKVLLNSRSREICDFVKNKREILVLKGFSPLISKKQVCVRKINSKNRFYIINKEEFKEASIVIDTKHSIRFKKSV